ncbi:MAG: hypothetical protein K2O54_01560, partial [Prevotella sp.]|nr:hypothetical protein [Prevotella sp.]
YNIMNLDRFKNTFIWVAANGYKKAIRCTIGLFFAFLLVYCINLGFARSLYLGETWEISMMENVWGTTVLMICIVLTAGMCCVAADMRTNEGRVMTMMLPASNAEKFWARILWLILSLAVSCVVAIICADIMRVILSYIVSWPIHGSMLLTIIMHSDVSIESGSFLETVQMYLMPIYISSVFVVGGTFFRRNPFLFTLLSVFLLFFILGLIVFGISNNMPSLFIKIGEMLDELFSKRYVSYDFLLSITNLITIALIALNYWIAYKLYCRIQVISNKWINL